MKVAQMTAAEGRSPVGRKIDIFRDTRWVEPLPIYAYLIEHPEGLFLVDTGDTWRNSVPGYLPWWNPFFTKQVSIRVAPWRRSVRGCTRWGSIPRATSPRSSSPTCIMITPAGSTTSRTHASSPPRELGGRQGHQGHDDGLLAPTLADRRAHQGRAGPRRAEHHRRSGRYGWTATAMRPRTRQTAADRDCNLQQWEAECYLVCRPFCRWNASGVT
jgi:hypothetical protein